MARTDSESPTIDFQDVLESAPDAMVIADDCGRIVLVNAQAERMFGYRRSEMVGRTIEMLIPKRFRGAHAGHRNAYFDTPAVRPMGAGLELYARRCDGSEIPVEISLSPLERAEGRLVSTTIRDVTDRRKTQAQLAGLLETAPDAMVVINEQRRIALINAQAERMFGYTRSEMLDKPAEILLPERFRREHTQYFKSFIDNPRPLPMGAGIELCILRRDGTEIPVEVSVGTFESTDGILISSAIRDITERHNHQQELEWYANHDQLTGLLNRRGMLHHLHQAVKQAHHDGSTVAVLLVDLDRFKLINDSLGHDVGDFLLQQLASRLRKVVRGSDTVARLGGDEFAVITENVSAEQTHINPVAERILQALNTPFSCANQPYMLQASIGISVSPDNGSNPQDLLRHADLAMYEAKARGGHGYAWANLAAAERVSARLAAERALHQAITNDELEVHFQPQYRLADGSLYGVEALLRARSDQFSDLAPGDLVSLAEASGLILPLGERILEQTLTQFAELLRNDSTPLRLAMNLSVKQFHSSSLVDDIAAALARYNVPASRLELEITEQALLQDAEATQRTLAELRALGIGIAIDDFGTGYSSLSYLKHFAVDTIKIDREFIDDLESDNNDQAIVQAILAMAKQLRMTVIAEGVETPGQADYLYRSGCEIGQGFLWSPARPAHELTQASTLGT